MTPDDLGRRRAGKRFNERLKLSATFLNNAGIAILVGAFVLPAVEDAAQLGVFNWASVAAGVGLHFCAQGVLTFFRSED